MGLGPERKDSKTFGTLTHPNGTIPSRILYGFDRNLLSKKFQSTAAELNQHIYIIL